MFWYLQKVLIINNKKLKYLLINQELEWSSNLLFCYPAVVSTKVSISCNERNLIAYLFIYYYRSSKYDV